MSQVQTNPRLQAVSSLKVKLGLLVATSVVVAVLLTLLGSNADVWPITVSPAPMTSSPPGRNARAIVANTCRFVSAARYNRTLRHSTTSNCPDGAVSATRLRRRNVTILTSSGLATQSLPSPSNHRIIRRIGRPRWISNCVNRPARARAIAAAETSVATISGIGAPVCS